MKFRRLLTGIVVSMALLMAMPANAVTRGSVIQFLLSQVRTSTKALIGGKVYFYNPGTSLTTGVHIWLDDEFTNEANNPYTLDADATAQLYAAGKYRIVIKDAAGVTRFDRDDVSFPVDYSYEYDALEYGAGVSYTKATIDAALAAIGTTTKATLLLRPGTWVIGANADWSAYINVTFRLPAGAVLSHGAYTVNVPNLDASPGWHSGTGQITVSYNAAPEVNGSKAVNQFGPLPNATEKLINSSLLYGGRYIVSNQPLITSTTSVTAGTGAKTWTIATGLPLQPTEYIYMHKNVAPYYYLGGTITSYDSATGALVVDVTANQLTTETVADWFMSAGGSPFGIFQYQGSVKGPSMGIYSQIASSRRDPFNQPIAIYSGGGAIPVITGLGDGSVGYGTEAPVSRVHVVGATGAAEGDPDTSLRVTYDLTHNRGMLLMPGATYNNLISNDWDNAVRFPMVYDALWHAFTGPIYGNPKFDQGMTVRDATEASGGIARAAISGSATLTGSSTDITIGIAAGYRLLGAQLRVDTAITSGDGATSWSAAYVTGSTTSLCTGQAFSKNTKVNKLHVDEIASGETNIRITPNSGTFSGGKITAIVYYEALTAMSDAP